MKDRPILLGQIVGVHGLKGEVVIRSHTADPADIAAYGPLTDDTGKRKFSVTVVRVTNKGVIARIAGIGDRTAADSLKWTALHATRDRLPTPDESEFYHADLAGLAVVVAGGQRIGTVASVQNYGAGDLIEIRFEDTGRTELLPFTNTHVPEVDIAGGRIVVVMPAEPEDAQEEKT